MSINYNLEPTIMSVRICFVIKARCECARSQNLAAHTVQVAQQGQLSAVATCHCQHPVEVCDKDQLLHHSTPRSQDS